MENLEKEVPLNILEEIDLTKVNAALTIIDMVNGFCKPGCGNLAPPGPDPEVDRTIDLTNKLARQLQEKRKPIILLKDTHEKGVSEEPYPPHCEKGTGEEQLIEQLAWLEKEKYPHAFSLQKNCINGFIGTFIEGSDVGWDDVVNYNYINRIIAILNQYRITAIVTMGLCTDICDMQFVQTMLSVRNHGMIPSLKQIIVYVPACTTYDLPIEVARSLGLPDTAAHPRELTHYMGLYFMQMSGAILTNSIKL